MIGVTEQTTGCPQMRRSIAFEGIIDTLQWVIIALILALIFRAFVMEAFRIPTGSMAETLRGAHFHLRCPRCGYKYDAGADTPPKPQCPSCGYLLPPGTVVSISNGDRVLVLKSIYQFCVPKRWDVVVFKNPLDPTTNYIKRMIAGPDETVEIIDGDIYINGQIVRKPANVQQELWMPVYDNDYPAIGIQESSAKGSGQGVDEEEVPEAVRQQPFRNDQGSRWDLNANGPTVFALDSDPKQVNTIFYDTSIGNDFRATYGYNSSIEYDFRPVCSDLMVRFYVVPGGSQGFIGIGLAKHGKLFIGSVDFSGAMTIEEAVDGRTVRLEHQEMGPVDTDKPVMLQFANVDHQLILEFGPEKIKHDLGCGPDDAGEGNRRRPPAVEILGAGKVTLSHIGVYRDIYYISEGILRAQEGNGFRVGKDEFFVCGDNSPSSMDCRLWEDEGVGNNGVKYTAGTVPRDYLVGKAVLVYWSDAFKPFENLLPIIPNFGQIRFISGGSNKEL